MSDDKTQPRPPREGEDGRKSGGWQKPVQPPRDNQRPGGIPPKKSG